MNPLILFLLVSMLIAAICYDPTKPTWENIMRQPARYTNRKVEIKGKLVQIISENEDVYKIKVMDNGFPYCLLVSTRVKFNGGRPIEGDRINLTGKCKGIIDVPTSSYSKTIMPLIVCWKGDKCENR